MKVAQLCPTLCDPMDYTVHGILQARILEWVAVPFSRRSSQHRDRTQGSRMAGRFFTSWITREAQEYWSGWPIPSPGDLPNPGIKPGSPASRADFNQLSYQGSPLLSTGETNFKVLFPPSGDLIMYFPISLYFFILQYIVFYSNSLFIKHPLI